MKKHKNNQEKMAGAPRSRSDSTQRRENGRLAPGLQDPAAAERDREAGHQQSAREREGERHTGGG